MDTTIGTYCVVLAGFEPARTADSHLKRTISTNCCIHTVVPPDDGLWIGPKHVKVFDEIY